jgi:hypothetical protein
MWEPAVSMFMRRITGRPADPFATGDSPLPGKREPAEWMAGRKRVMMSKEV